MRFQFGIQKAGLVCIIVACLGSVGSGQIPAPTAPTAPGTGSARGRIDGRVLLPGGQTVDKRVKIILSSLRDPGMIGYTDTGGYFRYDNLSPGTYSIEAIDDGNRYENGVERVTINRAERINVQVYLRERNAPAGKPRGDVVSAYGNDQSVPGEAKREYEKARRLSKDGRAQEAIEHLEEAIKIYPGYLMAHNDLGVQYLNLGKLEKAADQFGSAIDIDPKAYNPRLNLGIVLIEQHRYPDAVAQLTQAIATDSSLPAGHLYLGVARLGSDDLDSAERELLKALELGGPPYWVAHFHLAGVHMKRGERDGAIRELEAYLGASPKGEQARQAKQLLEQLK